MNRIAQQTLTILVMAVSSVGAAALPGEPDCDSSGPVADAANHVRAPDPVATGNRAPLQASAFGRLPDGAVSPRGWLKRQLQIQADGLTSWTWSAFDCASNDANPPYHQEGVVALALVLRDKRLLKLAQGYVERRLSGNLSRSADFTTASVMRFMMEYQEGTGDPRIIPWMCDWYRNIDWNARPAGWKLAGREEHLGPLLWLYNRSGDGQWLKLASARFDGPAKYDSTMATTSYPVANPATVAEAFLAFPEKKPCTHGVVLTWKMKYPALLYQLDPKAEYRQSVFAGLRGLDQYYGQVGGRFAAHENLPDIKTGCDPTHGTELCNTVEAGYNMGRFFEWFGDPAFMDRLEALAFNTWPGEMTPDMWAHQYDTQANQPIVNIANRGWDNTAWANLYGFMPHWTCCLANMHQAWPRFVAGLWMATPDAGLAAAAYGPCEVTAQVGASAQIVTITEETDYPFDGAIRLVIKTAAPVSFPLQLRVPGWARGATAWIDGKSFPAVPGQMTTIRRAWKNGDTVKLDLPMPVRVEERFNRALAVLRGPLYFSLRIGQDYREAQSANTQQPGLAAKPYREKHGFPLYDWEIFPSTPWNYGLVLNAGVTEVDARVSRHVVGPFPFAQRGEPVFRRVAASPETAPFKAEVSRVVVHPAECDLRSGQQAWTLSEDGRPHWVGFERIVNEADEPVVLRMKAKLLPQWKLASGTDPSSEKEIPALAAPTPLSPVTADGPEVEVELIPYGCTRLRISEFPLIEATKPTG